MYTKYQEYVFEETYKRQLHFLFRGQDKIDFWKWYFKKFTARPVAGAETLEVSSGLAQGLVEEVTRITTNVASNTNSSSEVPTL